MTRALVGDFYVFSIWIFSIHHSIDVKIPELYKRSPGSSWWPPDSNYFNFNQSDELELWILFHKSVTPLMLRQAASWQYHSPEPGLGAEYNIEAEGRNITIFKCLNTYFCSCETCFGAVVGGNVLQYKVCLIWKSYLMKEKIADWHLERIMK